MKVERVRGGPWGQNCFVVSEATTAVVVDPGGNADEILQHLRTSGLRLEAIINTHGHFDHIGAVQALVDATGAPFHISALERPIMKSSNMLRFIFKSKEKVVVPQDFVDIAGNGMMLSFQGIDVKAIATPGHTPGGYSYLIGENIFTGDTVLNEMPGSAELPGGDPAALEESLTRLGQLSPAIILHPGHGRSTTLGSALGAISQAPTFGASSDA